MSPSHLILSISSIFLVLHLASSSLDDDEGFAYSSIRIRDEDPRLPPQRYEPPGGTPRRPNRRPMGGSRYLNRRRRPGRKQLDKSSLMVLMGDDYLTSWMSDERPKQPIINVPSNEVNLDSSGSWAQERLLDQLRSVNLTAELAALEPSLLPFEHLVRQWMVKRSSCPVEFTWKDLGPTYWPRWIRKGECANRKGLCSYPTGMHCVPGATTKVMLLFWDCEEKKNRHMKRGVEVKTRVRYRGPVPNLPESSRRSKKLDSSGPVSKLPESSKRRENLNIKGQVPKSPESSRRSEGLDIRSPVQELLESSEIRRKRSPSGFDAETSVLYKNRVPHLPPSTHIKKKKRCDWKKVPYPITVDCFCTC